MVLPKNILVVEDEVITQRYLQDIFEQCDVNVVACLDNAPDVIEMLSSTCCDMILMDINIKGAMDGIQLTRQILKTYDIPIVFITAHNDEETLEEILELAPYGFIGKPFSSKEIIVALQIAYKRYLTHIELYNSTVKVKTPDDIIRISKHYTYSLKALELYCDKKVVKLNKKQNKLLSILVENIGVTVDYELLISHIWDTESIAGSSLRTLVYSLRKQLPDLPILSFSKMGYALHAEE